MLMSELKTYLAEQLLGAPPHPIPPGLGRTVRLMTDKEDAWFDVPAGKSCPKCGKTLPGTDFYLRLDGRLSSWCKVCTRIKKRESLIAKKRCL
jgi:hypothetical protein